jgi:DNA uptake protein ComE-like DNA-binding protein
MKTSSTLLWNARAIRKANNSDGSYLPASIVSTDDRPNYSSCHREPGPKPCHRTGTNTAAGIWIRCAYTDRSRPPVTGSKVDLNTASEKDLDELPGVEESVLTFPLAKPLKVTAVQ